jgi:hypothetical protein
MTADLLARLTAMPGWIQRIAAELPADRVRTRPRAGGLSFVEHAWHLADLEREGYATRLHRLLAEDGPALADFAGDRIARERGYHDDVLAPAVAIFAATRRRTLASLATLDPAAHARAGTQQGVGPVTVAEIPRMMDAHDRGHVAELIDLLTEIAPDLAVLGALRAAALPPQHPVAA